MDRVILHCDCNNYFASVELLDKPELRDQPVAVAGDPEGRPKTMACKLPKPCGRPKRNAPGSFSCRRTWTNTAP